MHLLIITQKVDNTDNNLGFFHRWIEEFARWCESVIVICLFEGVHALPPNVRVLSLGKEGGVSRLKYLKRFFSYIWLERKNYDAVFVHMNQIYVILGGMLWRLWGKRIGFWYAHGTVTVSLRLATMLTNVIFTSTKEGFRISTKKTHVVGQGVDTNLFSPKKDYEIATPARFMTAGRITPSKNIESMIDAVGILKKDGAEVILDIVGSAEENKEYLKSLMRRVRENDVESAVRFRGGVPYSNLPSLLITYDLFINTGGTGSLDKAILDAAAAGVPVVSSNTAFRAFVPTPAAAGVSDGTASNLAATIKRMLSMKASERSSVGAVLRTRVTEEHSLTSLVEKILTRIAMG